MPEMFLIKKNTTKEDTLLSTLSALTNEIQRHMTLQRGGGWCLSLYHEIKKIILHPNQGLWKKRQVAINPTLIKTRGSR